MNERPRKFPTGYWVPTAEWDGFAAKLTPEQALAMQDGLAHYRMPAGKLTPCLCARPVRVAPEMLWKCAEIARLKEEVRWLQKLTS